MQRERSIVRRMGSIGMVVCAAPGYLRHRGKPRSPVDLKQYDVLSYKCLWCGDEWAFTDCAGNDVKVRVHPAVHATNGDLLRTLCVADGGIMIQTTFLVADELRRSRLVRILEDYRAMEFTLSAMYLNHQHLPSRVRVFIDYLVERLGDQAVIANTAAMTTHENRRKPMRTGARRRKRTSANPGR